MECDIGRLQAYLDDGLAAEELAAVKEHLTGCGACQEELEVLQRRGRDVVMRLAVLDPEPHAVPDAAEALARFRQMQTMGTSRWAFPRRRIEMMKQILLTSRWRPAAIGLVALAFVVALFSFAPARQAAAQFLGIFRVRKFAVIPVDPAQLERLESLENLADAGLLGEPTYLRQPGEPQSVTDAGEASALAGFKVRVPTALPETATLRQFAVETGPTMLFEIDPGMLKVVLEAAGVQGVTLPAMDSMAVEVDVPAMVQQTYRLDSGTLSIVQLPGPTVTLPSGVDPAVMGEMLLQLLGMPTEDARRVAKSIDWTSTLVIPLPTDVGRFHEVEVDGVTGLLLEEQRQNRSYRRHLMVLWQRDDLIYSIEGENVDPTELLRIADSLR